jgi:hypothetical protein
LFLQQKVYYSWGQIIGAMFAMSGIGTDSAVTFSLVQAARRLSGVLLILATMFQVALHYYRSKQQQSRNSTSTTVTAVGQEDIVPIIAVNTNLL